MEHNDHIAYKTWIENLREPAPEGAWDAIADQLDIDTAWDNIAETLDLDAVWQNLDAGLPQAVPLSTPSASLRFPKLFWAAAALILLTLTTPLTEQVPEQKSKSVSEEVKSDGSVAPEKVISDNEVKEELTIKSIKQDKSEQKHKRFSDQTDEAVFNQADSKSDEPILVSKNVKETPLQLIDTLESNPLVVVQEIIPTHADRYVPIQLDSVLIPVRVQNPDSLVIVAAKQPVKDSIEKDQPERAKWQVGVIGSVKNTWLINPETADGLKRSSLNDTRVTFGKEFGLTLQRSIGGASAVQFEYYFYSEIGQRYHEYINALYQAKDVKLRYQKFQVIYRTRIWRNWDAPALYAVGGVRVSRLTLADTEIGNENQVVTQEYRPWDYGFILGGEAEFVLTNKLILVSGLRASYGLRNIYLGNGQAPAEFNKTHTASVGLAIGLKYKIN